jgi:hypothetical protein
LLTVKFSAAGLWRSASPLLEEKSNLPFTALISEVSHMFNIQCPVADATFATGDDPINRVTAQIKGTQ